MSFRPRFPTANNKFLTLPTNSNNSPSTNANFTHIFPNCRTMNPPNANPNPLFVSNSFAPTANDSNKSNYFYNNSFTSGQPQINSVPFPSPASGNTRPAGLLNFGPQVSNVNSPYNQYYPNQPVNQNPVKNLVVSFETNSNNTYCNNEQNSAPHHNFGYPLQNVTFPNPPPIVNYQNNNNNICPNASANSVPKNFSVPPPISVMNENSSKLMTSNLSFSVFASENVNNSVPQPRSYTSQPPILMSLPQVPSSNLQSNYVGHVSSLILKSDIPSSCVLNEMSDLITYDKEVKLSEFLAKCSIMKKKSENTVTVPEFRYALKAVIHLIKVLCEKKKKLTSFLDVVDENEWKSEMESVFNLQEELSAMCSIISAPACLNNLTKKLDLIKKRRSRKKKTKENKFSEKVKANQNKKELSQEIDKWLDDIKEKNLKQKRELEMKKEADFILLEVRRKIHEANKTIEKIKVFEKLRNARQANAVKKGLHVLSEHNEKFEKKMSVLKETMLKQLTDYEAEEKALKVMLETEQEGQLEEEAQWKIKKAKTLQQKRHNQITECLFGISDDPLLTDPLYLFYKFHVSANSSIENLVQIRHQWDIHVADNGESIPRQWVIPTPATSTDWENCWINVKN